MPNPVVIISRGVRPLRNGNRSAKEYPYWEELIKLLSVDYEVVEVVKEPLDKLEKLLKEAKHVICCDSFLQHFCWHTGVRAVVLWGSSDPLIFGHSENINILKDRKYVRPNQFDTWENEPCNPQAFVSPKAVIRRLKELDLNLGK
jgi:ADP-heptose:LPS heptosyltransferase